MVKSTGTALATAVGGADYEFPLTFTGIASRTGNTVTVTAPSGSVPTTSALGQSFQNNGTGLIVSTPALEAAAVGIICDGSTDNGVTGNNSLNAATLSGHAVHLTDGATCVGQINGGVNNTRFYCNGCTLADPTTDVSTSLVHLAFAKNIMFDGIALDTRGTNHQSFQGNSTAQSSVITASGGSGWQANYRIPFNSTGGGCVWNAAGYITTDGSGIPNGVVTYTTGQGCTSQPTTWNIGTYCGDGLSGCVAPTLSWQGGLSLVAGTANAPVTYVEFSTGIVFRNCTWRATGATLANLKGNQDAVKTFSSQVLFENPTVENTLRGTHFFVDSNGDETRKTTIRNVASDGSQIDGVQMKGYPGGTEVDGGLITNVGDAFAGSGQQGNAISVLNTSRNYVHGVTIRDPYFSGVRVTGDNNHNTTRPTSNNRIEDITIAGNLEMGVWAELGSEFNYFKNITVRPSFDQPSAGCLEDTNITQRAHYGYNYFTNMHCTGQIGKGAVIEHAVLKDSTFVDVAVPIQVGFGGTSTGNVVSGNTCTNSGSGYSSPSVCFALDRFNAGNDPTKGPSLIRWNTPVDYPFGGTATVPIAYLELTNFPVLSGITATNPAVFSYLPATAVQWPYSVGSTYMLQGIYGFLNAAGQSINGKLCGVTAVDTTAHTVTCGGVTGVPALDATSYTATPFTMAPAGRANAMPYWIYSGGNTTPAWPANTQMNVTNAF